MTNDVIKDRQPDNENFYVSWAGGKISDEALKAMNGIVDDSEPFSASSSYAHENYSNLLPNTSGRPGLTRSHYEAFRPGEKIPTKIKDIIKLAERIYNKVGLVRNVIDLMADFASEGVRVSHPDKRVEVFYRNWFKRVNGKERSERFLNNLYKTGNIVIRRQTVKLQLQDKTALFKTMSNIDIKKIKIEKIRKREIPWKYTFLNPATIEVVGGSLASFAGIKSYAINLPEHIKRTINHPTSQEKKIITQLPKEIRTAAKNSSLFVLPVDKTLVFHYKKDDWQDWAIPMTYPIMDDIVLLEKLKLADSAALDGAISNVRIFTLGDLEHGIAPSPAAARKLKSVLQNNVGGGTIDVVWTPDIKLQESKTDVHKFLGQEKYVPTLNNIYGGIGIPPTLTGAFSTSGTTNNFISLKTLIQRLQYGRDILISFWQKELEIVQKAMNFAEPASIEFDYPDLGDSDSEKSLLIQMSDRNLISDELLQERFKHNTRLESSRISREHEERKQKDKPPKAGPYYNAQPEIDFSKIALQSGQLSPEQVGVEFEGKSKPSLLSQKVQDKKPKGQPQQGRPKNSRDTKPRKTKQFVPKTKASINLWATNAQEKISSVLNPAILHSFDKKNMRSLTTAQHKKAEKIKLGVLFNIEPFSKVSENAIIDSVSNKTQVDSEILNKINDSVSMVCNDLDRKLSLSELHTIYSQVYTELQYDY